MLHTYACKTLASFGMLFIPTCFDYGPKIPDPGYFLVRTMLKKNQFFFLRSVQIYMKDEESAKAKEKSNFSFFLILFFTLWSFLSLSLQFSMHFSQ